MATPSPQEAARRWATNLSQATQTIRAGVEAVQESPTEKAASQVDAYMAGVQRAVNEGKYQAGLRRVSLQEWKNATLNKGLNRIAAGATAAQSKFERFMNEFLPFMDRVVAALPARGDQETNIQRAVTVMREAAKFKRSS